MSKEPDWEAYDPQIAWEWHDWAEDRIEELERVRAHDLEQEQVLLKRIEELEAFKDAVIGWREYDTGARRCNYTR